MTTYNGCAYECLRCHLKALCCLIYKTIDSEFWYGTDNRICILCSNDFTFYSVCKPVHSENLKFLNTFFLLCACMSMKTSEKEYLGHLNYAGECLITDSRDNSI